MSLWIVLIVLSSFQGKRSWEEDVEEVLGGGGFKYIYYIMKLPQKTTETSYQKPLFLTYKVTVALHDISVTYLQDFQNSQAGPKFNHHPPRPNLFPDHYSP